MTDDHTFSSTPSSITHTSSTAFPKCQQKWKVTKKEKFGTIPGNKIATSMALSLKLP